MCMRCIYNCPQKAIYRIHERSWAFLMWDVTGIRDNYQLCIGQLVARRMLSAVGTMRSSSPVITSTGRVNASRRAARPEARLASVNSHKALSQFSTWSGFL